MKLAIFTFLLLSISIVTTIGQTIDGTAVYLDTAIYYKNCLKDSIIYNKALNSNDTILDCSYYQRLSYRELNTDSLYDVQEELMMTGVKINNRKNGIWRVYNYHKSIDFYCWERLIYSEQIIYFNDNEVCDSYFVESFSINKSRDSLNAKIIYSDSNKRITNLILTCIKNHNDEYRCTLQTEKNKKIIKEFPLEFCEDEMNLLHQGYYNHKITPPNTLL